MVKRLALSREQVFQAIEHGEYRNDVLNAAAKVIVIMTQDWCPQWKDINRWIYTIKTEEELVVYELIYNRVDYYHEFMKFKETCWGNHQIPYIRYYLHGKFVAESNHVPEQKLRAMIGI